MKLGMHVNLGDVIYYVNNGTKASQGDVQKKKDDIVLNCYLLNQKDIENNPEMLGEYNVPRAIATFNKRIEPLLVVFGQEVRDNLLVDDPANRGLFTKSQCDLINGVPFEEGDQDRLKEDLMDLSEDEVKFWEKKQMSPDYMYELAETGWEDFV